MKRKNWIWEVVLWVGLTVLLGVLDLCGATLILPRHIPSTTAFTTNLLASDDANEARGKLGLTGTGTNQSISFEPTQFGNGADTSKVMVAGARLTNVVHVVAGRTVDATELSYVDGLTNSAQTQLDAKVLKYIRVAYEGDSLVKQVLPTWPDYVATYSRYFGRGAYVTNYGNSGDRVSAMNGQYATEAHLNRPTSADQEGWFVMHGGGNDIADGVSAATVYTYLQNEWEAARLDGYRVVAVHVLPRNDFTVYQPLYAAAVVELNRLIDSDRTLYDYVVPADVVLSATSNTNLFYDGTHLTVAGANVLASALVSTIEGKAFELVPTSALNTNGVGNDLVLLPRNGRNVMLGVTTNIGVKLAVAKSYTEPASGGVSANLLGFFGNNGVAFGEGYLAVAGRSSGKAGYWFGDENLLRNDFIEADFAGGGLGLAFGVFGTERMHLDTTGLGIGTAAPSAPLEVVGTGEQFRLTYGSTTNVKFTLNGSGFLNIVPSGGNVSVTGSMILSSFLQLGASSILSWAGQGGILPAGDGTFTLFNNANTDFGMLQFGGRTTSFPGLRRNGAVLEVRLADASALSTLSAGAVTLPGGDAQTQIDGKQASDSDLTAVAGLTGTGLLVRTGTGAATNRTVTGTASQVTVTNGDGVSGNPVLSLPSPVVLPGALTAGGRVLIPYATLGATTIDCSAGDVFIKSVGTGETYTFSNTPASGKMQWVTVRLFNSSGGTITPAFTGATFTASLSTIAASKYGEYTFAVYGDGVIHGVEQRSF